MIACTPASEHAAPPGDLSDALAATALTLARRFAAGATLWSVSPQWPAHADHVAVEFVHPVVMGKPAVPAVPIDDPDPVSALRLLARPGDVLLVIGAGAERGAAELLRRSDAWGLTTVWLGVGAPPVDTVDHVLRVDAIELDDGASEPGDGVDAVLAYHLLWELTHVVFEHPGLLAPSDEPATEVCVTCSDEGNVVEVQARLGDHEAVVLAAGKQETVDVTLVGEPGAGDLLLVHAGVAIASIDEERQ